MQYLFSGYKAQAQLDGDNNDNLELTDPSKSNINHDVVHKVSYSTITSGNLNDYINNNNSSVSMPISNKTTNNTTSNLNDNSINDKYDGSLSLNERKYQHLSNISQLTVNDTTISSSDNDLLMDPLSFDDSISTKNINHFDLTNISPKVDSAKEKPLTLNDVNTTAKNNAKNNNNNNNNNYNNSNNNNIKQAPNKIDKISKITDTNDEHDAEIDVDDVTDDVHDYLHLVNVDHTNNQLSLDDFNLDLPSDFHMDFDLDLDLYTDSGSSISYKIPNHLPTELDAKNAKRNSKDILSQQQPSLSANSNITSSSMSISSSNLNTPQSKIINNLDVTSERLKRSFNRLKQTSELINTEKVYICSLKILEKLYLNNFMSDSSTPIYFDVFRKCVIQLLKSHQTFYDNLLEVYNNWYNDSLSLLHKNVMSSTAKNKLETSPNFDNFNYISNEKDYLEIIVRLISNNSIDVDTYSIYCSLFNKVLQFSSSKGIEKYKRNSLIILNDYLVDHKNLEADYFIDKHLDTRFISVVQMPTSRMVRYKLILQSLLKNIDLDEKNSLQLNYYSKSLERINLKIDDINGYVGNEDFKFEKLDIFKTLIKNSKNDAILPNKLFPENLESLQLSSSFGLVYSTQSSFKNGGVLNYDYVCGFLFKSHLILAKPSNIHSHSLDIKFIIPLISILNNLDVSSYNLSTNYNEIINLKFEDNFNIYELCLIFPNEKERLLWKCQLKVNTDKLVNSNSIYAFKENSFLNDFIYSELQENTLSIDLNPEVEKFNVSSFVSSSIQPLVKYSKENLTLIDDIFYFEVDHFNPDFHNGGTLPSSSSYASPINKMTRTDSNQSINSHFSPYSYNNHSNSNDGGDTISIKTKISTTNNTLNVPNGNKVQTIRITLQERVAAQTCIRSIWSQQFEIYTLNTSISRSLSNLFHSKLSLLSLNNGSTTNTPNGNNNNSIVGTSNNNTNMNNLTLMLNVPGSPTKNNSTNFIPPSPSFAYNNGSGPLGSPIKLRNSKSMRSIRTSVISSRNGNLPPTPTSRLNNGDYPEFFKFETPNHHQPTYPYNTHHGVRHSGSLRSLSSLVVNNNITNNNTSPSNNNSNNNNINTRSTIELKRQQSISRNKSTSTNNSKTSTTSTSNASRPGSATDVSISSSAQSTTAKMGTVRQFWKSLKHNKNKK